MTPQLVSYIRRSPQKKYKRSMIQPSKTFSNSKHSYYGLLGSGSLSSILRTRTSAALETGHLTRLASPYIRDGIVLRIDVRDGHKRLANDAGAGNGLASAMGSLIAGSMRRATAFMPKAGRAAVKHVAPIPRRNLKVIE